MEHPLLKNKNISESAQKMRTIVDKAISDEVISHDDYDKVISLAGEDGHVDVHEQAILTELHQMIHDKDIKFKTK